MRVELTHRTRLAFEPVVNSQAEIAGVPAELLAMRRSSGVAAAERPRTDLTS